MYSYFHQNTGNVFCKIKIYHGAQMHMNILLDISNQQNDCSKHT